MRRGKQGRVFDVTIYLATTIVVLVLAGFAGGGAYFLAALIPFGFAVWRANAD